MTGIVCSSAGSIREVIGLHHSDFAKDVHEVGRIKPMQGVSRVKRIGFGLALSVDNGTGVKSLRAVPTDTSSTKPEAGHPIL